MEPSLRKRWGNWLISFVLGFVWLLISGFRPRFPSFFFAELVSDCYLTVGQSNVGIVDAIFVEK